MLSSIAVAMPKNTNGGLANPGLTNLSVEGMTCNNCARHVVEALQEIPEVASATVSLETALATIRWRPNGLPQIATAIHALKEAGYDSHTVEPDQSPVSRWSPLVGWRFNAVAGSICTVFLLAGEWLFQLHDLTWFRWTAFIIASFVQVVCGARFYRGAWSQLKTGSSNMDTLVSLGSTTAYLFSVWALFANPGSHIYFMEAVGIISFVSVGHWLEARVSSKASAALRGLLQLAPVTARVRDKNGMEREVPVADLKLNDTVILRPGDRVPTDGEVIFGDSTLNESMLTGESLPVTKKPGDQLFGGTTNLDGQMVMRVTAVGEATALAQIVAAVQRAQNSRANIQRLGDRVSNVFVPIVIACAVLTGLWWGFFFESAQALNHFLFGALHLHHLPETPVSAALIYASAVLIVACPCAMGLATPIAIMAGTNAAAARGILIRDGVALEKAGKISAILFDKTGTLTEGKPAIADQLILVEKTAGVSSIEVAAALARRSSHPLSRAVAQLATSDIEFTNWQEVRGSGLQAVMTNDGKPTTVRLGSLSWLTACGLKATSFEQAEKWMEQGGTVLGLAWGDQIAALFSLQDRLKSGAADVVGILEAQGLSVFMVTGDNERTARALAGKAGIAPGNVAAGVRPENKATFVKDLQARGERVGFIGDGINDAPALEQADLGIAVAKASDIAAEAADIILLKSDIHALPETLGLAAATLRTVKQNLFWAFFYNAAFIPLAALGLLSPLLCAAAMGFSDLIVIGNALRLRHWKIRR
jgi:Cu+-exporting ATPase